MNIKYMRVLSLILIMIQLFSFILPISADDMLVASRFNLNYFGDRGYQIMALNYESSSVETTFESLAERAIQLKQSGSYSSSEAIQILTETKAAVNKLSDTDYAKYGEAFERDVANSGNMSTQFTYDSFIMRNVMYAMVKDGADYNNLVKAIQLIYDTGVIQTQKRAFRSDALDVLRDLNILASYTSDKDISDLLYYISNLSSGIIGSYTGSSTISSINISFEYQEYLDEEYERLHGGQEIEHNTDSNQSEYFPGGFGGADGYVQPPSISEGDLTMNGDSSNNEDAMLKDTFLNDVGNLYEGKALGNYVLCYTLDKESANPTYNKTKINTKQFITYENILEALKTVARNSKLIYVEDTEAVLLVYDGVSFVLEKSDTLYDAEQITALLDCFKGLGFVLVEEVS